MADKSISELNAVTTVNSSDSFVLQQNNTAMRLTGQVLLNWLVVALDGHGGISGVAKTGTNVLTDTYTITYADETTSTFTVTNGKGISSIAKTGTSTLIDTYTITYNDNTTSTFTVNNGKGVSNVTKSTSGLVDTYRMNYNDGTHYDFSLTNGRGITSVTKTGTNVLEDTYTIAYNNNTTSTFIVKNGKGITSVTKTSDGLEDTYTILYNDNSTFDFLLTNGRGINSITKTTSGLADTYTLGYNDGTTYSFTVNNGVGINNISKASSGLSDTYTISYNNGTHYDMVVTNGRGITAINKTGTEGRVDTYTISYNDNTTSAFLVTNGEKGDTGDADHVWIRYADESPTKDSDMRTTPSNWFGVYSGTAETAPTHYTDYDWFLIKGAKGETGDDVHITSTSVQYQISTSGTIAPSTWLDYIPQVPQGNFLWSRTEVVYSTGTTTTTYSVSRSGIDGMGSVVSVNHVAPTPEGDVELFSIDENTFVIEGML